MRLHTVGENSRIPARRMQEKADKFLMNHKKYRGHQSFTQQCRMCKRQYFSSRLGRDTCDTCRKNVEEEMHKNWRPVKELLQQKVHEKRNHDYIQRLKENQGQMLGLMHAEDQKKQSNKKNNNILNPFIKQHPVRVILEEPKQHSKKQVILHAENARETLPLPMKSIVTQFVNQPKQETLHLDEGTGTYNTMMTSELPPKKRQSFHEFYHPNSSIYNRIS